AALSYDSGATGTYAALISRTVPPSRIPMRRATMLPHTGAWRIRMNERCFARVSRMAHAIARACSSLIDALHKMISFDTRPYHPERYFMRGPGPAWRAKHMLDRGRTL